MPIYEFRCPTCKTTVEKIVKIGTQKIECPNCGDTAEKQLSAPGGFQLKGDGFYKPSTGNESPNT